MSIQNRLLLIYSTIFTITFVIFALVIYTLPRNRILAEVDRSLEVFAAEVVRPGNIQMGSEGIFRVNIPEDLVNFETASTFLGIVSAEGKVLLLSSNLTGFDGLLDPNGLGTEKRISSVHHGDALLRVLTVPVYDTGRAESRPLGYVQVARLLDNYESFNRLLIVALMVGFAAATASVFIAVWLTPSLFKPLEDIATVARQITRADDLSRRVPDTGRTDQIGDLARALNQTLERLEKLFWAQQRLLADVSHELRTPLTAIRGNLDLMRRMGEADPESLAIIQDEVDRMTRLVGDLLLLARADAGGLPLERKLVELDNILFEVYRQVSLWEKSVDVSVVEIDQVHVWGDADRLKQLLLNLIDNAIKYTPANGRVSLSLAKAEGWAYIVIADTGIGIPPEDLPYVFDRFYRVDKARSRGGSGLGLSIAKSIAQAHGGDIHVTSRVGEGTTFTIRLPMYEEKKPAVKPTEEELEKTRPGLRLLGSARKR